MNKQKYINKIIKSRFKRGSKFNKICLRNNDLDINIVVEKIRNANDIEVFVKPLQSYYDRNFMTYPLQSFNTTSFLSDVDLVFLDTKYCVVEILNKVKPNTVFNFDANVFIVLIMESNKSKFYGFTEGIKLKMAKYIPRYKE